jgi:hypothetical protein
MACLERVARMTAVTAPAHSAFTLSRSAMRARA